MAEMHDIMRERLWRKLEVLPDEQLYQALDYIEFLEYKYAAGKARRPGGLQAFAERLEDGLRARSVAPKVIKGTVGIVGAAHKAVQAVSDVGNAFLGEESSSRPPARELNRPARPPAPDAGTDTA